MRPYGSLLSIISILFLISDIEGTSNLVKKWRRNLLFDPDIELGFQLPPSKWFDQTLDHFHPTDGRTWKQRLKILLLLEANHF